MKRFLLFGGENYYPQGGFNDFIAEFDTYDEARKAAAYIKRDYSSKYNSYAVDWTDIVDTHEKFEFGSATEHTRAILFREGLL